MDLQEATLTMALLMKEEYDFYEAHATEGGKLDLEDLKQLEWRRANTREFGNRLAADPNFFDVMESWVVTIIGRDGVNKDSMFSALESDDVDDLVDRASPLASSLKEYLRSNGYVICDMSAGEDGWDIGVRCSEKQSRELCRTIYQRYIRALDMKLLFVSRRFSEHHLPGLRNWDDAKKIIIMYGDSLPDVSNNDGV